MKIASIQLDIVWEDKQANLSKAERLIQQAKKDDCDLVVLPEMFNTGFSMNASSIAESVNGKTTQQLCEIAKQNNINLIAGITESLDDQFLNIAIFITRDGEVNAKYIKNYPYTPSGESKAYSTGNEQVIFDVDGVSSSLFICYDLRFPELFRKVAKQIEIIFIIASWPEIRQDHWESLLKARAIENQCFVVGVNRIGSDANKLAYAGGSHVFDPLGKDLSRGGKNQEYIVTDLDIAEVNKIRRKLPFLEDIK